MTQQVYIKDMSCDHCAMSVRQALEKIDGVSTVTVDLQSGVASVNVQAEIPLETYAQSVSEAGYTVGAVR
tara:strand:- start:236 stop:445 length:210 start_codon:yes stop_codon:yes gene_type:complete